MEYIGIQMNNGNYICHHGVKGQKWGRRRYQNEDGSLINGGNKKVKLGIKRQGNYAFRDHKGNFHLTNKEENKSIRKNLKRGRAKAFGSAGLAALGMGLAISAASARSYKQMGIRTAASLMSSIGGFALSRSARKNIKNIQSTQRKVMKRHGVRPPKYKVYR